MNVLLVSQCNKNALKESRRILDQFAERRGERTWQTAITQEGLNTLRKLLRKTARKNTAVACHWIRGKDHSELMWIVGDASQFNMEGATPTNSTARNVLRHEDENDWHTLELIRVLAQFAGLLHDLGKASIAFQERLKGQRTEKNLYRHEWVSLRLFQAFVGTDTDEQWLQRLADETTDDPAIWTMPGRYWRDGLDAADHPQPFRTLSSQAPVAAAIGWLIVTHHRLPLKPAKDNDGKQQWLGTKGRAPGLHELPDLLSKVAHDWNEQAQDADQALKEKYWSLQGDLPVMSPVWRKQAAKLAKRLISLQQTHRGNWLDNPYVMHLARLCLMLGDHHYSSLGLTATDKPVAGRVPFLQIKQTLAANTTHNKHGRPVLNQSLLEHLLGVAQGAASIAHALPGFERYLPRLANHRGLRKRSGNPRFSWQDKAFDAATAIRESARQQGAFIINMASTGCGKTLANARILYALASPQQGMRATYALGLRTLTLQTGRSYRKDLHLNDDELAIQVGGSSSRALFEYYEQRAEQSGSASVQELLEEDSHVLYEGNSADHPLLAKALANADIRKLLSAPMLVCTVDHLVPATESQRAGRQIAPMLRLMSSDLILDELDDYDLNDLPALTRLVYWAGLLGSRVILSSATLPPALVAGMFMAYRQGRQHYLNNRGADGGETNSMADIPCLWVDEFGVQSTTVKTAELFEQQHQQFIGQRVAQLAKEKPCRQAEILPLDITTRQPNEVYSELARILRDGCIRLHHHHSEIDPVSAKQVSFGMVRMANIEALTQVARALYALGAADDVHIHLCVYHSRFPLVQRSAIENLLDSAFNRRGDGGQVVYQQPQIRHALDTTTASQQLFVVLASPVCEVGRDWDADWAIAEPSSMRSFIQLAGRVQRHRRKTPQHANMLLLDAPVKYFTNVNNDDGIYQRPGFEKGPAGTQFRLTSPWLHDLLQTDEYQCLNAVPRILPRNAEEQKPQTSLVDLEQARIAASMYPRPKPANVSRRNTQVQWLEQDEAAPGWRHPHNLLTGVLAQYQPFRDSAGSQTLTLVFRPDDDEEQLRLHRVEANRSARGQNLYIPVDHSQRHTLLLQPATGISVWGDFDLMTLVREQAEALDMSLERCAEKMTTVEVLDNSQGWNWHPWLGFMKRQ
ncbi:type I-F CRISPR-associated helicase Cas3f [Thalassolituus pacificus]|uniref:Type I-F CRISPR-associated helicase Cas3f n=1 Tax=Thalassolituus pacificus TaxID=2975440 RepID=A0A9X3APX4_9GAMM|nr:type I-F CRISPR-associated helicase Cas3f [Thalassolituus pacificus]MCT7357680.1 type I-F CRISPR-associated helicase Cas3f [Thalassolituus pacificus]